MAMKKWIIGTPNRENAKLLAEECGIDPFAALIACQRGFDNSAELELMLSDEPLLCDVNELADISLAAQTINAAIADKTKIAIFGDYDCDGVIATTLMLDYLKGRGADVCVYIPDRVSEGYGMNIEAVGKLYDKGIGLIITVDNGISCFDEIEYANSLGMKVVVTDHHIPPEVLPNAAAVVDPHRTDCPSQFKEICGAQVAFKLICVLDDKEPEQLLPRYADILSVAVIGDVMPLVNENRSIVKEGIKKIKYSPRVGISAILSTAGVDRNQIGAGKISFAITPRINAAGRMGDAKRAVELLMADEALPAIKMANALDEENQHRQQIEREILASAVETIENNGYQYNSVIVVEGENWHSGVVGIVASRICERYGKPAIILSIDGEMAHGSGRGIEGFHLYNAVHFCADSLAKYGGHELAAGVSLSVDKIAEFRTKINEYAQTAENAVPKLNIDFKINPAGLSVDMAHAIKALEPFGVGNPAPLFAICAVSLKKITPLSNGKHLKLLFSKNESQFQAVMFGVSPEQLCFSIGDTLDLAVALEANLFREEYNLSIQIKAMRISQSDDSNVFEQKREYDRFMSGLKADYNMLLPTRQQVGQIFKKISEQNISEEKLRYMFLEDIGYAKTGIAVKVLLELGLIAKEKSELKKTENNQKTDLHNSKTFDFLCKKVSVDD